MTTVEVGVIPRIDPTLPLGSCHVRTPRGRGSVTLRSLLGRETRIVPVTSGTQPESRLLGGRVSSASHLRPPHSLPGAPHFEDTGPRDGSEIVTLQIKRVGFGGSHCGTLGIVYGKRRSQVNLESREILWVLEVHSSIDWRSDPYFLTQLPSLYPRVPERGRLGGGRGPVRQ